MDRQTRIEALATVRAGIRASEEWAPGYKSDRAAFRALVQAEADLQGDAEEYLYSLSHRVDRYVDWAGYERQVAAQPKVQAATHEDDLIPGGKDAVWKGEALDLTRAIIEAISLIATIGVDAALKRYKMPLHIDSIQDFVALAAQEHIAGLVSGVTDTTRNKIRLSIKQSLTRGETTSEAIERLRSIINNPVRAEMIAQTESVNAYAIGQHQYATETGAKRKTWESLPGACEKRCGPINGQKRKIDETFRLADGTEVLLPAGHVRCRCGVYYEY
ncbi:phage minor head protein [Tsukamurella spumae]|uniref:Phage head morphogenesis domain-containing protein n=1 Tax=Tsukamurella spumae TaxID=44753 RepID=A0A846X181_9ACTN|nr:phage minor head protein [Tsukamurella spumae]NKY18871.1 hypothetical protein [Tsukamurella spumae]